MECSSLFFPLRVKEEPCDDGYEGVPQTSVPDFFRNPYEYPVKQEPQSGYGPVPRSARFNNGESAPTKSKYKKRKPKSEPVDQCDGGDLATGSGKKRYKQEKINEVFKERKKVDRFNGMPEEEVVKRTLPDHLVPNLDIVVIGINPGLFAAFKGHHYAGPGNHFWKCLFLAGLIPEPMTSDDDFRLVEYGIGFTNIVDRTTRGSADLTRKEIKEGSKVLLDKLKKYQPKIAVFNGKGIYEVFSGKKNFDFGKQPELIEGTSSLIYVMPSSSARCAQLPRAVDKVPFYVALKKLREHMCGRLPNLQDSEVTFPDVKLKIETDDSVKQEAAERHAALSIKEEMMEPCDMAAFQRPSRAAANNHRNQARGGQRAQPSFAPSAASALLALSSSSTSSSATSPSSPPAGSPPTATKQATASGKAKKKKAVKVKAEPQQHDYQQVGGSSSSSNSYDDRNQPPQEMMSYGGVPYPMANIKQEKMDNMLSYGHGGCPYNGGTASASSPSYNCPSPYYTPPAPASYNQHQPHPYGGRDYPHCPPLLPPPGPTQLGSIVDQIPSIGAAAVAAAAAADKDPAHFHHHHHLHQHQPPPSPAGGLVYFNQATAAFSAAASSSSSPQAPGKAMDGSSGTGFHVHPESQFVGQYPAPTGPTLQFCCSPGRDADGNPHGPGPAHSPSSFEQPVYTNLQSVRVKQERMDSGYGDF